MTDDDAPGRSQANMMQKACLVLAKLLKQALNGVQQPAPRQGRAMV